MFLGKNIFALVLLIFLIGFTLIGRCSRSLNAFLKRHRKGYGFVDTIYVLLLFSTLCNVLEAYMTWWMAGGISIVATGLLQYIVYSDHKKE